VTPARRHAILIALAAALPGCSLAPVDVEPRRAILSGLPADIPVATAIAATLLVLPTRGAAAYDTTQMAYSLAPHELAYFARTEWADTPAHMLNSLLVRTAEATRRFRAVAVAPHGARVEYSLATDLLELRQDFTVEPPVARLAMRLELRDAQGRTFASRAFESASPLAERSPQAGAAAASAAAAHVLGEVARFLVENTR
jgi:cholesterol transport system auxiliary component